MMPIRYILPALIVVFALTSILMVRNNRSERTTDKTALRTNSGKRKVTAPLETVLREDSLTPDRNQHVFLSPETIADSPVHSVPRNNERNPSSYHTEMDRTSTIVNQLKPGGQTSGSYQALSIPAVKTGYTIHVNTNRFTTIFLSDTSINQDSVTIKTIQ